MIINRFIFYSYIPLNYSALIYLLKNNIPHAVVGHYTNSSVFIYKPHT